MVKDRKGALISVTRLGRTEERPSDIRSVFQGPMELWPFIEKRNTGKQVLGLHSCENRQSWSGLGVVDHDLKTDSSKLLGRRSRGNLVPTVRRLLLHNGAALVPMLG